MTQNTTKPGGKYNWFAFILEGKDLSMGRIMAWVMFGILIYMWLTAMIVPETLITSFYVLISYNLGKKITGPIAMLLQNRNQKQTPPPALPVPEEKATTSDPLRESYPRVISDKTFEDLPSYQDPSANYPIVPRMEWEESSVEIHAEPPTHEYQGADSRKAKLEKMWKRANQ